MTLSDGCIMIVSDQRDAWKLVRSTGEGNRSQRAVDNLIGKHLSLGAAGEEPSSANAFILVLHGLYWTFALWKCRTIN